MKLGFEQARSVQDFQVISKVLGGMFGSGEDNPASVPKTKGEAKALFKDVFG